MISTFGLSSTTLRLTTAGVGLPTEAIAIAPRAYFAVIASSSALAIAPAPARFALLPQPALLLVDGAPSLLVALGNPAQMSLTPVSSLFEVVPDAAQP